MLQPEEDGGEEAAGSLSMRSKQTDVYALGMVGPRAQLVDVPIINAFYVRQC